MKAYHIFFVILLFIWNISFTQTNIEKQVNKYLSQSVLKKSAEEPLKQLLASDFSMVINALTPYLSDTVFEMRTEAYSLLNILGKQCNQKETRIKIVKQIIAGIRDKDFDISGLNMNNLTQYTRDDFDREAIYELSRLLNEKTPNYPLLIKIIGFVGGDEQKEIITKMVKEKSYPNNKTRLAMHLALARMGDEVEVDFLVNKVKTVPVNDDLIYEVFPDLIYTCKKKIYDYLLEIIMLDNKNCSSGDPNSTEKIICAYKIIEQIAGRIKNFPVEIDEFGDIKNKDYTEMLTITREWIKLNKENYFILTDKY